jgi:hypothetical protein
LLREHDPAGERRELTISAGEVRLDPCRLRRPDASEHPAHPRGELNSPWVLICVGGVLPGDSAVDPVVSILSHGCIEWIVARSDCWFVSGTTSNVQVISPVFGTGGFGSRSRTTPGSSTQTVQNARLDLRPFAVTRSDERTKEAPPLVLPRAQLNATILLPGGSEPRTYDVQLLDADLQSRATSTGAATIVDFVTTLATTMNTSALPAGSYQLAVRRQGEDWRMFPAQLR